MQKESTSSESKLEKVTFHWQFHLKTGVFECDEKMVNLLSPGNDCFTLPQLFSAFDRRRVGELKVTFKYVIDNKNAYTTSILMNIADKRFLVNFSFEYSQDKDNTITGKITFSAEFPTINEEDELIKVLFNRASNAILITDKNLMIIKTNEQFLRNSGYKCEELIGQNIDMLQSDQYSIEFYQKLLAIVDSEKIWMGELLAKNKAGEIGAHEIKILRIELSDNNHFYMVESKKLDFSSQFLSNSPLVPHFSNHGLLQKDDFIEKMNQQVKLLSKNETLVTAAFKVTLLQKVSESMLKWLISKRFVESKYNGKLGEVNNDIFIAMWVVKKSADKVNNLLQDILKTLSGGDEANQLDLISIINMGASVLAVDAKSTQQLVSHSVQTLITSPKKNESVINYFDARLASRFNKRTTLSKLLSEALQNKQVEVYYQPIADIHTMQIVKFEALMRITLDTEIPYNTQELIEIAEQYGWVDKVDMAVAKIALQDLKKIRKHYLKDDIGITLNRSLSNDKMSNCCLQDTLKLLVKSDIEMSSVTIELTESALFSNLDKQKIWVEKLRELGVSVALDDFGTGYSSFTYLNKLPVNIIKIDRSFVTDITLNSNEYMMIEMLCRLTHKMGGKVIAEGIENSDELLLLSRAKVDMMQGYLFSKPMSLKQILTGSRNPVKAELLDMCFNHQLLVASEIMSRELCTIRIDDRLVEAKKAFQEYECEYLLVLDKRRCAGILTKSDMEKVLSPYIDTPLEQKRDLLTLDKRIHQVMHKGIHHFQEDSPLEPIEAILMDKTDEVIIINNKLNNCIGFITAKILLNHKYNNEQ